jgi:hypothetical protein
MLAEHELPRGRLGQFEENFAGRDHVQELKIHSSAVSDELLGSRPLLAATVAYTMLRLAAPSSTGFTQPGGAMNWQLGAGLTLGWMLAFAFWGSLAGRFHIPAN